MDIVIITTVAQIVQHLLSQMREDAHATRQLHSLVHSVLREHLSSIDKTIKIANSKFSRGFIFG